MISAYKKTKSFGTGEKHIVFPKRLRKLIFNKTYLVVVDKRMV